MKKNRLTHSVLRSFSDSVWQFGLKINRREFLKTGVGLAVMTALPQEVWSTDGPGGFEVRRSKNGVLDTTLKAQVATNRINGNKIVKQIREGKTSLGIQPMQAVTVTTRAYGTIPAPVFRVRGGDVLKIKHSNDIPADFPPVRELKDINIPHQFNVTNLHTHGLTVPPTCEFDKDGHIIKCSDYVLIDIQPGESVNYEYEIPDNHPDGTFWYHPHKHGSVAFQLMGGMAGALIIEGPLDDYLKEKGVVDEQLVVIQPIRVKEDGKCWVDRFGDFFEEEPLYVVNGQLNPIFHLRPGEVQRWRFLNAGMSEHVPLQLIDKNEEPQPLYQIATDGVTLRKVVESELSFPGRVKQEPGPGVFMAAGNRVDVLMKCDKPGMYFLKKPEFDQGFVERANAEALIATVIVEGSAKKMSLPLDESLPAPFDDITEAELDPRPDPKKPHRILVFDVDTASLRNRFPRFLIGGRYKLDEKQRVVPAETPPEHMTPRQFDPNRLDQVIREGAVEEWTVVNDSTIDHPFHLHQVPFFVTEINDPRPNGNGITNPNRWQDVQNIPGGRPGTSGKDGFVPGSITFRVRFDGGIFRGKRASLAGRAVLHCHILDHEDTGMMQLIEFV